MIRRFLALLLVLLLPVCALADPLLLTEDLAGVVSESFYEYSYRYPRVDASDTRAPIVNNCFDAEVNIALNEGIPSAADYWESMGQNAYVTIDYEIKNGYVFVNRGHAELRDTTKREEVFMATAVDEYGWGIVLLIVLEIIGAVFLVKIMRKRRG